MTLTRSALDELLETLVLQLAERLAIGQGDPIDIALWLERRLEVIRGFAAPDDSDYLEERLAAALPQDAVSQDDAC